MHKYFRLISMGLFIVILPGVLSACDVPVFRYALERWPTEQYVLTYDTTGGITPKLKTALEFLKSSASAPGAPAKLHSVC